MTCPPTPPPRDDVRSIDGASTASCAGRSRVDVVVDDTALSARTRRIQPTIDVEEHHTDDRARTIARATIAVSRVAHALLPHGLSSGRAKEARSCVSSLF